MYIYLTRICVITLLLQSGGGTSGTVLYTVSGVGSESRDVDTWHDTVSVHRGSGAPSTDDPGTWQNLVRPDPRVRKRISDRCDPDYPSRPHWFSQVVIKTHSFRGYVWGYHERSHHKEGSLKKTVNLWDGEVRIRVFVCQHSVVHSITKWIQEQCHLHSWTQVSIKKLIDIMNSHWSHYRFHLQLTPFYLSHDVHLVGTMMWLQWQTKKTLVWRREI